MSVDIARTEKSGENWRNIRSFQSTLWLSSAVEVPDSFCSSDVYRRESGRCCSLPFILNYFLSKYLCTYSCYISLLAVKERTDTEIIKTNESFLKAAMHYKKKLNIHVKRNEEGNVKLDFLKICMADGSSCFVKLSHRNNKLCCKYLHNVNSCSMYTNDFFRKGEKNLNIFL